MSEQRPRPPAPQAAVALNLIAAILSVAALYLGREFFIPVALAFSFYALLRPVVRKLEHLRIPTALAAAIVVLGGLGVGGVGGSALSGPVSAWVDKAPASLRTALARLSTIGRPLDRLTDAALGQPLAPAPAPHATPATGSLYAQLLGKATSLLGGLVEVILLLYLMLAAGNLFLRKMVKVLPASGDKRTATDVLDNTESIVAHYLLLNAIINLAQAITVGFAMWAIGIPDPLIWGLLTFALEFIPYLGGVTMVGLLLLAGFTTFAHVGHALLAPGVYFVITTLQNSVLSPYVYGGRLKLSPLAVLVCVLFWWWVWGIAGVFLAIPIAATLKALGDQIPRLAPLGEFLGE
ncbi:MAG TPA: AI-2E family transporter [Gemmatimonadales bacterium]|nr:AI-2E family transporter [Gemmatimonadales bacterium]